MLTFCRRVQLKAAIIRLRQQKTKKSEYIKQQRLLILQLIKEGKDELARIRVALHD